MARKSMMVERRGEILDALEICIARYGFQESTLERIAQLSGIQRPALRHFIGNRDQIRVALAERYFMEAEKQVTELDNVFDQFNSLTTAKISSLITKAVMTKPNQILAISNLMVLSNENAEIKQFMQKWFKTYTSWLANILQEQYKDDKKKLNDTAHGIVGICISMGALSYASTNTMNSAMAGAISQLLSPLTPKN